MGVGGGGGGLISSPGQPQGNRPPPTHTYQKHFCQPKKKKSIAEARNWRPSAGTPTCFGSDRPPRRWGHDPMARRGHSTESPAMVGDREAVNAERHPSAAGGSTRTARIAGVSPGRQVRGTGKQNMAGNAPTACEANRVGPGQPSALAHDHCPGRLVSCDLLLHRGIPLATV